MGQSLGAYLARAFCGQVSASGTCGREADTLKMIALVEEAARAHEYDIEVVKLGVQPWRCERCGRDKDVFVRPKHVRSTDDLMCASCWLDQSRKEPNRGEINECDQMP